MKLHLTNAVAAFFLLLGCTTAQSDRAYFCSLDGSRLDDAFFDRERNVLVLGDVVMSGNFDCEADNAVCFHSGDISFEFPREGTGTSIVSNDTPWGIYQWEIDYSSGILFFRTKREGTDTLKTCAPFIS
ncbi:hypothetical protein FGU71_03605 [Erythrobacter insulae]|uniref:Uncharacterized protein n=1 Tax=Erythrobacter insulae TaxID=2584124 RepID=A0A547PA52_9SPHN|nr:hypothetical protein [Erythrobacter insulae]TRD11025.1 hypothetical protein FGU71_03605 [Erythrobacter insulae]